MALFENFPYTNFHDLNLDWILQTLRDQQTQIDDFVANNVLSYAEPFQWNITRQYSKNTVVLGPDGSAYMSIKTVPDGVDIDNTDYWQPIFNYNQIINDLESQIAYNNTTHETFDVDLPAERLVFYNGTLYWTTRQVLAGDKIQVNSNVRKFTVEDAINCYPIYSSANENLRFSGSADADGYFSNASVGGSNLDVSARRVKNKEGETLQIIATGDDTEQVDGAKTLTDHGYIHNDYGDFREGVSGSYSQSVNKGKTVTVMGDSSEDVSGAKIISAESENVTITGNRSVTVGGKLSNNATDILLNPSNPLTYSKPFALNDFFNAIKMRDTDGVDYNVLVETGKTSQVGSFPIVDANIYDSTELSVIIPRAIDDGYSGILLSKENYTLNSIITFNKPFSIYGVGEVLVTCDDGAGFKFDTVNNITLQGFSLIKSDVDSYEIETTYLAFSHCSNIFIENVVSTYGTCGVAMSNCSNIFITNCKFNETRSWYISALWFGSCSYIYIYNTIANNNKLDGLMFDTCSHITVSNCEFSGNGKYGSTPGGALGACGIYFVPTSSGSYSYIVIDSCIITANTECGIDIRQAVFSQIRNNTLATNGLSGVRLEYYNYGSVTDNNIFNNGRSSTTSNPDKWGHSGIDIASNILQVLISNNKLLDSEATRTQQYGINVLSGGATQVMIANNSITYNKSGSINGVTDDVNSCFVKNNMTLS